MARKQRNFVLVSHCLLNPHCRVHILGKQFPLSAELFSYLLSKRIGVIQIPCPEFTAMGYWRNPQGRQQYDNVFFRKHCLALLKEPLDITEELTSNGHKLIAFIGVQGSPTCSIVWDKHKKNKYNTESIVPDLSANSSDNLEAKCGILTEILKKELNSKEIFVPFIEAPIREEFTSEAVKHFFNQLDDALDIPTEYRKFVFQTAPIKTSHTTGLTRS